MNKLTPEERAVGQDNYYEAVGVTRRDFLKEVLGAGVLTTGGIGALYFGYQKVDNPVRVAIIGTGDEGNVLIGALNPEYMQVTAICDIRPSNVHRAFHGDYATPNTARVRPGLMKVYDWKTEQEAKKHVKVFSDYRDLLKEKDIEAVIIALPLHLHAPVAVAAMAAGKHVLTEKLMAHNIAQCKIMGRVAKETNLLLATGHQRHYSILYDNAVNLIRWGILGEIHHIRAQWHRGNLPGRDSWQPPLPGGEVIVKNGKRQKVDRIAEQIKKWEERLSKAADPLTAKRIAQWKALDQDKDVKAEDYGYQEIDLGHRKRSALEELIRWRLWTRTGGGLMAELGSHQLDAASIFISALRKDGKKTHPLSVHAVGGRQIFPYNRDAEDHVYCMFEFPGPGYEAKFDPGYRDPVANYPDPENGIPSYDNDKNKKIVVTYSSINGNGFGGYGEIVMGTRGTLVLEKEQEQFLYRNSDTASRVTVKKTDDGAVLDTTSSGANAPVAKAAQNGPVSRGYREQMEHFAWCIRNRDPANIPRCHPEVAVGDAIMALTAKRAIAQSNQGKSGYIEFQKEWFDIANDATPDGSSIASERENLKKG